jgi:AraC-like DNA-binding protein
MRPWFETVVMPPDRSWLLFDRQLPAFPFNWHYHPEFELTLTLNSTGMRFVGDHVAGYCDGDLVLLGPNLPHAWESHAPMEGPQHRALVCWFTRPWADGLVQGSPELGALGTLLEEARRGVVFGRAAREAARQRMLTFGNLPPARQWLALLELLLTLSEDTEREPLASSAIEAVDGSRAMARLAPVLAWLNEHYTQTAHLDHLAGLANLSVSQLQRLFKRSTRMSVSDYVAQRRIGHACGLLAQDALGMSQIGALVGYADGAQFSRQFKATKGCTPSQYRELFRQKPARSSSV